MGEIRKSVGDDFPIGIKLNSADFQRGGFTEEESMRVLGMLQEDGIDLVEISGGSYEARVMLDKVENEREAFFLDYAKKARSEVDIPMMVTGGFRARSIMEDALATGALDVVGMARPFTNNPSVARDLLDARTERAADPPVMPGLGRLGGTSASDDERRSDGADGAGQEPDLAFWRPGRRLRRSGARERRSLQAKAFLRPLVVLLRRCPSRRRPIMDHAKFARSHGKRQSGLQFRAPPVASGPIVWRPGSLKKHSPIF